MARQATAGSSSGNAKGQGKRKQKGRGQRQRPPVNNAEYAYRYLVAHGLSNGGAAGVVGNLVQESGVNPASVQDPRYGQGRGIAQWTAGDRWATLQQWAASNNMNPGALDTQLGFLLHELKGMPQLYDVLQKTHDANHATLMFTEVFERPDMAQANMSHRYGAAGAAMSGNFRQIGSAQNYKASGASADYGPASYAYTSGGGGGNAPSAPRDDLSKAELADQAGYQLSFLKAVPELWELFQKASKRNWDAARLANAIRDSEWYKTHSADQRLAQNEKLTDHSTWLENVKTLMATIKDSAIQLGASLTPQELRQIAENAYTFGLNDAEIRNVLAEELKRRKGSYMGEAGGYEDTINQYARAMGVRVSDGWTKKAVTNMVSGDWDEGRAKDSINRWAMSAFPSFRSDIEAGMTMQDIASPYMNSMESILERGPGEVDLFNPHIRKALTMRDEKGKANPQSLWDFEVGLRKTPEWLGTKNAQDSLTSFGMNVLQQMGFEA